jgi:hypothetical protein
VKPGTFAEWVVRLAEAMPEEGSTEERELVLRLCALVRGPEEPGGVGGDPVTLEEVFGKPASVAPSREVAA